MDLPSVHRRSWVWLLVLAVSSPAPAAIAGQSIADGSAARYETVVEGLKYHDSLLQCVRGTLEERTWYRQGDYTTAKTLYVAQFALAGTRLRYTVVGLLSGPNRWGMDPTADGPYYLSHETAEYSRRGWPAREVVCNGDLRFSYDPVLGIGTVGEDSHQLPLNRRLPFTKALLIGMTKEDTFAEMMAGCNAETRRYLGRQKVCDLDCELIGGQKPGIGGMWEYSVWVSPQVGWGVVKYLVVGGLSDIHSSPTHVYEGYADAFDHVSGNVWLPKRTLHSLYKYSAAAPRAWIRTEEYVLSDLHANEDPVQSWFDYRFPPAARILGDRSESIPPFGVDGETLLRAFRDLPMPKPSPTFDDPHYAHAAPEGK